MLGSLGKWSLSKVLWLKQRCSGSSLLQRSNKRTRGRIESSAERFKLIEFFQIYMEIWWMCSHLGLEWDRPLLCGLGLASYGSGLEILG